jgi:hypothetical protein
VGTESDIEIADFRLQIADYCRAIETYLCRKNDGHLIRVVGPSFEIVSGWAERGIPIKVAYSGIERYFERYYRKGPRRRPVKIDFCEADVLDVFDEWRRAVGLVDVARAAEINGVRADEIDGARAVHPSTGSGSPEPVEGQASADGSADSLALRKHPPSLPAHLERVVLRLTSARAGGLLGAEFDALIDRVAAELDAARAKAGGLRGEARHALLDRLSALDAELLHHARAALDEAARAALAREADEELAAFRAGMTAEAFARARDAAVDRLVRERHHLPVVSFK